MYIYTCMYIQCIYVYVYTYMYIYIHVYTCICLYMYVCIFIHIYTCIYICIIYTYMCMNIYICIYIHICMYIYTHANIHSRITCSSFSSMYAPRIVVLSVETNGGRISHTHMSTRTNTSTEHIQPDKSQWETSIRGSIYFQVCFAKEPSIN